MQAKTTEKMAAPPQTAAAKAEWEDFYACETKEVSQHPHWGHVREIQDRNPGLSSPPPPNDASAPAGSVETTVELGSHPAAKRSTL